MRSLYLTILSVSLLAVISVKSFAAESGYFLATISQVEQSAKLASQGATLEDVQAYARHTMALADAFQKEAQAVEDFNFVNEAVEIYNSASRAAQSASLQEARRYALEAASSAQAVAEQSGVSIHDPYARPPQEDEYRSSFEFDYARTAF